MLEKCNDTNSKMNMTEANCTALQGQIDTIKNGIKDSGYTPGQFGAGIIVFSLILVIPATAPGYFYIRYFCDKDNHDRVAQLPIAHYCLIAFNVLWVIQNFWKTWYLQGVMNIGWCGVQYYFLLVVRRFVDKNAQYQ